jgi:hypothetical protein
VKIRSTLPHSWPIELWPAEVFPNSPTRGRYTVRMHRAELEAAGALSRVGRQIVVIGEPYGRWLQSRAPKVSDFAPIAPNREHSSAPPEAAWNALP